MPQGFPYGIPVLAARAAQICRRARFSRCTLCWFWRITCLHSTRTAAGIVSIPDASSKVSPAETGQEPLREGSVVCSKLPFSALGMMPLQSVLKGPGLKN
jgi:hypothetical protein